MEIGSPVWFFDQNRRIYRKDIGGAPIWREHWRPEKIVSETSRSWISTSGVKVPKKGPLPYGVADSEEAIDRRAFMEQRWRIAEKIRDVMDYDTLRKIADLVGYKSE